MHKIVNLNGLVRFGTVTYNPASGFSQWADSTPRWLVFEEHDDTIMLQDNLTIRGGLPGVYKGAFFASGVSGFETGKNYEVFASGRINGLSSFKKIHHFIVDEVHKANIVQVSGTDINYNDWASNLYFADIKFIKDNAGPLQDDYGVQWFKNAQPVNSGQLTNPAISVFNTVTGTALFADKAMSYSSMHLGSVRYTETTAANLTASGIPYVIHTSGTIDGQTRVWRHVVGLDT